MMMLNEKALHEAVKEYNASIESNHFGATARIITAYLAALPSSPVSELVERLRQTEPRYDRLTGEKAYDVFPNRDGPEAADRLTALEAENAQLREALEFYADTSKYPAPFTGGFGELYYDCGQNARAALSTAPQGGDHGE